MVKEINVKAVTVKNLGVDDVTISPPNGAAPVVLVINKDKTFVDQGTYHANYGTDLLTAVSFDFSGGILKVDKGRVTDDNLVANITITATLT